jgi:hypothetical protein
MRVQVCRLVSYRSRKIVDKLESAYGTVERVEPHWEKVSVRIDHLYNDLSNSGLFFFKASELKIVNDNKEENNMSNTTNITNYLNAIKIKFVDDINPCGYVYASFESDLKIGDLVVVKPAHHKIALARVEEILEGTSYETSREVVAKVDTGFYNERVKIRNQAAELKAKMEERARKLQDIALYQMLAENDPDMKALLNEYRSLPEM